MEAEQDESGRGHGAAALPPSHRKLHVCLFSLFFFFTSLLFMCTWFGFQVVSVFSVAGACDGALRRRHPAINTSPALGPPSSPSSLLHSAPCPSPHPPHPPPWVSPAQAESCGGWAAAELAPREQGLSGDTGSGSEQGLTSQSTTELGVSNRNRTHFIYSERFILRSWFRIAECLARGQGQGCTSSGPPSLKSFSSKPSALTSEFSHPLILCFSDSHSRAHFCSPGDM